MYHLEGNSDHDTTLLAELYKNAKTRWQTMGAGAKKTQGQVQDQAARPQVSRAGTQDSVMKK
jgi:hypothetical protein